MLAHKNYAHCAPSVDNFLPFCALCTANALLTQRILSILWITFSKNYNSLAAAFANDYATPSQKIRKISDGVFTKHAQRSAAISNIRVRVRSKMTDCATARHDLLPSRRNKSTEQFARRRNATAPKQQYIPLPRMFSKRRQRKRMARPRADDRNRISARTARSSQTPYQCYIAPRRPRSAGGKQNAAKYRFSAALCRLYARPATRQIGANRKRYSARTLRIPQLSMIASAPSSFLLRKPRTSLLPASPLLPQR